ncbi:MAG: single-stranded DNA-binding protein [Clostridia bacterium]|jgi:single-strand DNA-binding protein|nr:single-stranded DNA-binding protein [Clostridia bacterium]MDD4275522.1 single-stranded DNA-binding protein [Clostridia bacterium]
MNKVILIGNLTKDPELATTTNGISVCRFTLAVSRKYKNAEGEYETDFLNVVVWRGQAENCHKYLRKGSKVAVVGAIQTRSYDAQDGTKKYVTDIVADEVEFLSTKNSETGDTKKYEAGTDNKGAKPPVTNLEPVDDDSLPF